MDDLDRLFTYVVKHLAATAPDRLHKPFQISELYQRLIPYRMHRRELGFEAVEDYEMAILRLLSGESGYAAVDPADAQGVLAAEVRQVNPNPGAFREFAAATVILNREAVQRILQEEGAYAPVPRSTPTTRAEPQPLAWAPPAQPPTPEPPSQGPAATATTLPFEAIEPPTTCPNCAGRFPAGRRVVYCPFCGQRIEPIKCRGCGELLDPGWKFCLTCGSAVTDEWR